MQRPLGLGVGTGVPGLARKSRWEWVTRRQVFKAAAADSQAPSTPANCGSGLAAMQERESCARDGRPVPECAFIEHLLCTLFQGVLWGLAKKDTVSTSKNCRFQQEQPQH